MGPDFHDTHHLWPPGYSAEWTDEKGVRFVSTISETPQVGAQAARRCGGAALLPPCDPYLCTAGHNRRAPPSRSRRSAPRPTVRPRS